MKTQRLFPALGLALCCLFLSPGLLRSQMPQRPGKLYVTSAPPGGIVTIDDQQMRRTTPFTFVVSPGYHKVKVTGPEGKPMKCNPASPNVRSGFTVTVNCTAEGREPPAKK
ncbi:MAG: PEGA domain-containing protein [Bryobacteraceae bacterium]